MKICNECNRGLPLNAFLVRKKINYREGVCRECQRKRFYNSNEHGRDLYQKRQNKIKSSTEKMKCSKCGEMKSGEALAKSGRCKECHNVYMRDWNSRNKDKISKQNKKYRLKYPNKFRDSSLRTAFGIGLDGYNEMLKDQEFVCAICKGPETTKLHGKIKNLAVDHCHETGKVRGLLCAKCNTVLGTCGDNIQRLQSMISYLER